MGNVTLIIIVLMGATYGPANTIRSIDGFTIEQCEKAKVAIAATLVDSERPRAALILTSCVERGR